LGRRRAAGCTATLEELDDDHAAAATRAWGTMLCRRAGCQVGIVVLRRRIDHRDWHCDQFSGARNIGLAAGAGE
jgi:hypothetical protein